MDNVISFKEIKEKKNEESTKHKVYLETSGEAKYYDVVTLVETMLNNLLNSVNVFDNFSEEQVEDYYGNHKEILTEMNLIKSIQILKFLKMLFNRLDITTFIGSSIWMGLSETNKEGNEDNFMVYVDQRNIRDEVGMTMSMKILHSQIEINDVTEDSLEEYLDNLENELFRIYSVREAGNFIDNLRYITSIYEVELFTGKKGEQYLLFNLNDFLVCSLLIEVYDDSAV